MTRLAIRVLGPFEVTLKGKPITSFETIKARALLAYLAAEAGSPHRREALAEMLWPDRPEGAARANLRHTLRALRLAIGDHQAQPPFLHTTRQAIALNPDADCWVDTHDFARSLAGVERREGPEAEALEQALSLYRGAFLEDLSLPDAALFEEWRILKREQLQRQVLDLLSRLVAGYERQGEYQRALAHAWRKVDLEPWDETAHRQVMRLLARSGRRAEALGQYEACRKVLADELRAEPETETTQLYEQIQRGELGPETIVRAGAPIPVWNLPAAPTPFFGRTDELAALEGWLANPDTRLVTVTGPGGSGKTRLALEAGARVAERDRQALADGLPLRFRHGVVFVPLAAVDSVEGLMPALADALGLRLQGGQEQLIEALRRKELLLILDNLEHLLAGVELLAEILRAAPGVQILDTSRQRLQLQAECMLPLGGLVYPEQDFRPSLAEESDADAWVTAYPALQLLVESARRVQPRFVLAPEDLPVLLDLCRQVDGLPLALELAASWADSLSLDEILVETRQSLGFLQAEWRDAPERHRSMRAVFDVSWRRLDQAERAAFSQLSVFRGGFGREAAAQVIMGTAAAPRLLATLVRKSFLQHDPATHRYQVHELLRQYGSEKLNADPALETATRDQHSQYYCERLGHAVEGSKDPELPSVWTAIQGDIENVRAACLWAATCWHPGRLVQAADALGWFYYRGYGNLQQGEITLRGMEEAMGASKAWPASETSDRARTLARILAWRSTFRQLAANRETAKHLIRKSLALLDGPSLANEDCSIERAHIAFQTGYYWLYPDAGTARQHFAESFRLYQEANHKLGMGYALLGLGRAASYSGAQEEAREAMSQSISVHQAIGNRVGESEAMAELGGLVAVKQFRFREAEDLIRQGLSLAPETNRFGIAYGLGQLCGVQLRTGHVTEAETTALDAIAAWEDLGLRAWTVRTSIVLAEARLHRGAYPEARVLAEETVSRAREIGFDHGVSQAQIVLGEVLLAEAALPQAYATLQNSLKVLVQISDDPRDIHPSAWIGLAARGLDHRHEAWQHLATALEWASRHQEFRELMVTLTGIALLLADEGRIERAVELYALASRYPFVANSCWFADVAGDTLAEVAATLPADQVAVLQERGRARELEATVVELLSELRT
jgi:DNA-binding SARP family transcriptional activator/predicted ATPase